MSSSINANIIYTPIVRLAFNFLISFYIHFSLAFTYHF